MKIAQVVCVLPPYGGGIGVVAHFYATELARLFKHEVDVYVPKFIKPPSYKTSYNIKKLIPLLKIGNAAYVPSIRRHLKKGNYDVVHLHYPFLGGAESVYSLKKKNKIKKLVISYHMDFVGTGLKGKVLNIYAKFHTKRMLEVADKIIVSSFDYVMDSYIRDFYLKNKNKFVELPFGVRRIYRPRKKDPYFLKKFNIKEKDKVLLFVGGLDAAHYFKGVNYLINAMKYLDDNVKLIVAGEGDLKKDYIKKVKELGLEKRIHFAGYVERDILPEHYNLADLFVLPSVDKSEAFGLVLIESLAAGTPVIASNLKGVRTVVDSGRTGMLFEPKNARDIADKAKMILNNPKLYEQFSQNAARVANQKYRWPKIAKKLNDVYKNVV